MESKNYGDDDLLGIMLQSSYYNNNIELITDEIMAAALGAIGSFASAL
jgi:hypothetical protein